MADIAIAAEQTASGFWNFDQGNVAYLRIAAQYPFRNSEGVLVPSGNIHNSDTCLVIECVVNADKSVSIPDVTELFTTQDSIDNPNVRYIAGLFPRNGGASQVWPDQTTASGFFIAPSLAPATTWSEICLTNLSNYLANPPQQYLSMAQLIAFGDERWGTGQDASDVRSGYVFLDVPPALSTHPEAVGSNSYASTSHLGIGKLSVAPVNSSNPLSAGDNDPRLINWTNVKGAPYYAKGDNSTDDTVAIQAAIDATSAGGVVYFPSGIFKITSALTSTRAVMFKGTQPSPTAFGVSGSQLVGNFSGYLIKITMAGITGGVAVEDLRLVNSHATGGGISYTGGQAPARLSHLSIEAYRAITVGSDPTVGFNFTAEISDVQLKGTLATGGWGIYTRGHCNIFSADIANFDNGIRAAGGGFSLTGGRIEVNKYGIVLGKLDDNSNFTVSAASISGVTFEANDNHIWLANVSSFTLNGLNLFGSVNSPSGQSITGLVADAGTSYGVMQGVVINGTYSQVALKVYNTVVFSSVEAYGNTLGASWDVRDPQSCVFIGTDYNPNGTSATAPNVTATQFVRSLSAADQVRGLRQGKNLRGINVAVASGATSVDITFPNLTAGSAIINTATATGSGNTLPAGTYYYIATLVNEVGESAAATEKTVIVTAGQKVDVTFFGLSAAQKNWKRRIYRGTATGVYDGYFEHGLESSATFSDTGQAFTGKKTPPAVNNSVGTEPDAVYAVTCTPAWSTTCYISNKATSGFTINFGTAPGSDSTIDWIIVR